MSIDNLRSNFPDYAKDIKINLSNILTEDHAKDLTPNQIYTTALSCAYAVKSKEIADALLADAKDIISEDEIKAAKAAATIMAMNNIYYRFVHLVSNAEYQKLPANLRMSIIARPGVEKKDFELYSLAVSAINGCGMCIDSHTNHLEQAGFSKEGIQSAIRIAAIINAANQVLAIEQ